MASPTHNTSLSLPARLLLYLGPPSIVLLAAAASPRTGLIAPLAFVPTTVGFRAWKRSQGLDNAERSDLEPLIWTYASTATIGFVALVLAQFAIMAGTTRLLFPDREARNKFFDEFSRASVEGLKPDELAHRAAMASSWQNWVFNTTLSFAIAGALEEALKAAPIFYLRRQKRRMATEITKRSYLDYVTASALSFGLVEGIGYIHAACESGKETGFKLLRTLIERLVYGSMSHVLCASLTALRATRKDFYGKNVSWWRVVAPAILLHGTGNSVAFALSSLEGNVGWIYPSTIWHRVVLYSSLASINGLAGWLVYKEWKQLQEYEVASADKQL